MKVNFNGVEAPKNVERVAKVIEMGIQELAIEKIDIGTAQTGTAFVEVTLNRPEADKKAEWPLRERFYLSPKSLWRLQFFLNEVLGRDLSGQEIDIDELKPELIGKVNTYVVNGEEYLGRDKDDNVVTKLRGRLSFNNFINPPAGITARIIPLEPTASPATASNNISTDTTGLPDDLPF